mgnify:CR=1 FL=1
MSISRRDGVIVVELVICEGGKDLQLELSPSPTFLYRIGSCVVNGREVIDINDSERLNAIAVEIRDEYSEWIYSINKLFLENKIVSGNLSLFFLTDLSCKRSEFFSTYQTICNLILIREKLKNIKAQLVDLYYQVFYLKIIKLNFHL